MDFGSIADKVVDSAVAYIIPVIIGIILATIRPVRIWFAEHPSITGLLAGVFSGTIVSLALWTLPPRPVPPPPKLSIIVESKRIGPNGVEGEVADPGYFDNTKGRGDFASVPESGDSQICTLSNILPTAGGACQLHYEGDKNQWLINASGGTRCRVNCFKIQVSK